MSDLDHPTDYATGDATDDNRLPFTPPALLPTRIGPRPLVTGHAPQVQQDQFPQHSLRPLLLQRLHALPGVTFAPSRRAPLGTVGLHLCDAAGGECAFMIDQEFAHVHPGEDGSMHMLLPATLRLRVIEAGWAEPHPLAGLPTVPRGIVFVYAPRTLQELDVVVSLAAASWRNAARTLDETPIDTTDVQETNHGR